MLNLAVRKEPNGSIYLDKNIFYDERFTEEELLQPPYNYSKIELSDEYADCTSEDLNDDLTFNLEKYKARKFRELQKVYEEKVVEKIREKYNVNQEIAVIRQQVSKPEEFAEYSAYVDNCKAEVKQKLFQEDIIVN